jgi:MoaA/NifB/PqqE/SkfB family radical SAM enzyme
VTRLDPRPTSGPPPAPAPLPRTDPIEQLPILILYPHARCNCRCVMCDIWRVTTRDEIEPERIAEWLPELRALGVRRVVLSGGEALLHSRLRDLCELLDAAGIGITVLTTGLLLERDAPWLVQRCDDVVVSLDGPRELHNEIRRVPTAWDKLASGVRALRAADPAGRVRVTGRCTVQRMNHGVLRATVVAARELGLDGISFLAADVTSEAFNRPGGWPEERAREIALDAAGLAVLASELDALASEHAADFASGFIAESPAKLRARLHRHFAGLLGVAELEAPDCNAPWVSAVIETDGTVRPCFFQPPLGNIRAAGGLGAVLNSPSAVAWRRGLDVARNEICRRCVCSLALREISDRVAS